MRLLTVQMDDNNIVAGNKTRCRPRAEDLCDAWLAGGQPDGSTTRMANSTLPGVYQLTT